MPRPSASRSLRLDDQVRVIALERVVHEAKAGTPAPAAKLLSSSWTIGTVRSDGTSGRMRSVTCAGSGRRKCPRERCRMRGFLPGFRPEPGRAPPQRRGRRSDKVSCGGRAGHVKSFCPARASRTVRAGSGRLTWAGRRWPRTIGVLLRGARERGCTRTGSQRGIVIQGLGSASRRIPPSRPSAPRLSAPKTPASGAPSRRHG